MMRTYELQELVSVSQGLTYGRHTASVGKPYSYLQAGNLQGGKVVELQEVKQEELDPKAATPYIPRKGMLLVSLRTPELRVAVVEQNMPKHVVSNNLTMLTLRKDSEVEVRPAFLSMFLRSEVTKQRLAPLYKGSALPTLALKDLKQMALGIPSLTVQDALINAQQTVDELEDAYRDLLSLRHRELEAHVAVYSQAGGAA